MRRAKTSGLSDKKRYLQVAFNSTLDDAREIMRVLPASDRIIIEAGTPLIKRYGMDAIRELSRMWIMRLFTGAMENTVMEEKRAIKDLGLFGAIISQLAKTQEISQKRVAGISPARGVTAPYIIADMKTIDRGATEVAMCREAGASAVIAMGSAPIETLNAFVASCESLGVDAMIDMMNVEFPVGVLRALKKPPRVVVLHRGVDEERDNKQKMLPLHEIRRIKGAHDVLIAVAGGDTTREVQSVAFNDADIVVVWKSVYEKTSDTISLVDDFLKTIK